MRRLSLLLMLIAGCGAPSEEAGMQGAPTQQSINPVTEPALAIPRKVLNQASGDGVQSLSHFSNTGVKQTVLLSVLNTNTHPNVNFHHTFELVRDFDDVRTFKDQNSPFILMLNGPKEDLILIELAVRLTDFVVEDTIGEPKFPLAGALGRIVQRIGLGIDPSWSEDLYEWTAKTLPMAMIMPDGARMNHKHLIVQLGVEELPNGVKTMNFAIGQPERKNK